jgi:RNA polymerase sigma factor (sigma-70 family)
VEAAATALPGRGATLARAGWRVLRSDAALVERFRAGDEQAFAALYRRHQSRIYAVCLGVLGSPEDAKDAMQEVWAAATTGLPASAPDNVSAWLARVARNSSIDIVRGRRETPHPAPHDLQPESSRSPEPSAGARADLGDLVRALSLLPERQRSALLMRELGGYSYAEIGRTLQLPERSVSGLIARARISLREARRASLSCGAVRDHLAAEIDGRRRPAEVRRHLRSCRGCREFRGALRDDRRALRSLAPLGLGKLLAVALAGRGGRAAVVAVAIGKGTAGGETVKLAAFCAAAVCATAGVEQMGSHAVQHDRPSAGVAGSDQGPATSGPRRTAVAATPSRGGWAQIATRRVAPSAAATAPTATATAPSGSTEPTGWGGGGDAWNPDDEGVGPPAQAAGSDDESRRDDRDPRPAGSGGTDRSQPEGGGRDGGALAARSSDRWSSRPGPSAGAAGGGSETGGGYFAERNAPAASSPVTTNPTTPSETSDGTAQRP